MLDANDDGFVTDRESDAYAARIFETLDADGDGSVSKDRYMECQRKVTGFYQARSCPKPAALDANNDGFVTDRETDAYSGKIFQAVDKDNDGKVSRWDYMQCQTNVIGLYDLSKTPAAACPAPAAIDSDGDGVVTDREADAHGVKIFEALDADGDNIVSKAEYMACQKDVAGLYQARHMKPTAQGHAEMDADKSGEVSFDEFMKGAESRYKTGGNGMSADQAAINASVLFKSLDEDGDGSITRDEWLDTGKLTRAEANFHAIDRNGDSQISRAEFLQTKKEVLEKTEGPTSVWMYRAYRTTQF